MKRILCVFALLLGAFVFSPFSYSQNQALKAGKKEKKEEKEKKKDKEDEEEKSDSTKNKKFDFEKFLKKEVVNSSKSSFVSIYQTKDKVYLELPLKYMNREMLMVSTIAETTDDLMSAITIGLPTYKPMHIKFTKTDSTVFLRDVYHKYTSEKEVEKAYHRVVGAPIRFSYPVKTYTADSTAVLLDVSNLFADNIKEVAPIPDAHSLIKIESTFKKENSRLKQVKAFEDNFSVQSVYSYLVTLKLAGVFELMKKKPVTLQLNRSLMLLPEDKMEPRILDTRVAVFLTEKQHFSEDKSIQKYSYAYRWRVEPSDSLAYAKGELVKPKKPIVFYIDDAFPESWKEPVKKGVLRWNKSFEKIGFKDAIEVRDFPQNDSIFDPDNVKYSCVRYVPSATSNAMGPVWVDPNTGEILSASVIIWSNLIKLIRDWRFVQTSQIDPRVRAKHMPEDIFSETLEYAVAHEVGHCLGFMHNMGASATYPVDSLRSIEFTAKHGTTPTIMDYARLNYVAQPEDKGVKLTPPDLGAYDHLLVEWNYKPFEGKNLEEKTKKIEKWLDKHIKNGDYRYGIEQVPIFGIWDPSSLAEDLGDDAIKAGEYGIKNLQYIMKNLDKWVAEDDDFSVREEYYKSICAQYLRYVLNATYYIGGVYLNKSKEGTGVYRKYPVTKEKQREALRWVVEKIKEADDFFPSGALRNQFALTPTPMFHYRKVLTLTLYGRMRSILLASTLTTEDKAYKLQDFFDDFYHEAWRSTIENKPLGDSERVLQENVVKATVGLIGISGLAKKSQGESLNVSHLGKMSLDEMIAYSVDDTGVLHRFQNQLRKQEYKCGIGCYAKQIGYPKTYFSSGYGYQTPLDLAHLDNSAMYVFEFAKKMKQLLKKKARRAKGEDKLHYNSLLQLLENVLGA